MPAAKPLQENGKTENLSLKNKTEIIMKRIILINLVMVLSTMYIIAQNSPCDCKEPNLKNVNVEKMILEESLEYLRGEVLIDGYDALYAYFKCIAQCKSVQKEKLTNNGLTYGTKYTYKGKSVTIFSGQEVDNSSTGQTVSQQTTAEVNVQNGEGENVSPDNSPNIDGAPNISENNSGVNANKKAQYELWKEIEKHEKEKNTSLNVEIHEGSVRLSDIITNSSLNKTQYNTTVLYDIMAETDRVGQIANSREGQLTQYDKITTIDPDLLPDKLQTTVKWGLFQGNYDVVILTDNYSPDSEETDEDEQTEIQSKETGSSNHAHQPNAIVQQIENNEVAQSQTPPATTQKNEEEQKQQPEQPLKQETRTNKTILDHLNRNQHNMPANEALTHLKEIIKYEEPTTIITTSGETYDAPAGSYFTGTVKDGKIEQGTLYNENKKPLKTFFRKK
jgi:hypothetical protein